MGSVRNWMKEFLIIYLILTIMMHLAATEQYKKYLRFFSGIILLSVLLSPVLHLLGNSGEQKVLSFYEQFWEKLDSISQDAPELDSWQDSRQIPQYENAVEKEVVNQAEEMGIAVNRARVQLSDDYKIEKITVWMAAQAGAERQPDGKDRLAAYLGKIYELDEGQIVIY